jgi:microcompartment protein CcmK/EutM
MRLGQVIGRVTLNVRESTYAGGRLLLVSPLSREQVGGAPLDRLPRDNTAVVYDELGAGRGDIIGFVEGTEATAPFSEPIPIDAYNCAIVESINYEGPDRRRKT